MWRAATPATSFWPPTQVSRQKGDWWIFEETPAAPPHNDEMTEGSRDPPWCVSLRPRSHPIRVPRLYNYQVCNSFCHGILTCWEVWQIKKQRWDSHIGTPLVVFLSKDVMRHAEVKVMTRGGLTCIKDFTTYCCPALLQFCVVSCYNSRREHHVSPPLNSNEQPLLTVMQ